jgi:hypothetical protein
LEEFTIFPINSMFKSPRNNFLKFFQSFAIKLISGEFIYERGKTALGFADFLSLNFNSKSMGGQKKPMGFQKDCRRKKIGLHLLYSLF